MSFQVSRRQRSFTNTTLAMISQMLVVIVGLFLPRAIIQVYGSETNGLVTSLQQIITYFTLVEGGLAGATVFALYKPLAENNINGVNHILSAAKRFYRKAGVVYFILLIVATITYPSIIAKTSFADSKIMLFVLLIGVNGATQLWFNGKYKALLIASQYNGIVMMINSTSAVVYSALLIVLAKMHVNIVLALGMATFAFLFRALAFFVAAKKIHPQVNYHLKFDGYRFRQRNDVFFQQILGMIVLNSSVVILTVMKSTMENISVYTVYNFVLSGLFLVMYSIENSMTSGFGDVIARGDIEKLKRAYKEFEAIYQIFWSWVFSCISFLFLPFITAYSLNFTDAKYVLPHECIIFTLIGVFWTIRNQQSIIVTAAGRFREMRKGNLCEAILAVGLSIIGYYWFGLIGLLYGRLISVIYRTIDLIIHCNKHVLKMSVDFTFWQIGLSLITVIASYAVSSMIFRTYPNSFIFWTGEAVCCAIVSALVVIAFRLAFDSRMTLVVLKHLVQILKNTLTRKYKKNVPIIENATELK